MASFGTDRAYDSFMGRYSEPLAPKFAEFAAIASGMRVLDVGAGTGALTGELLRRGADVAAAEPADAFVEALRGRYPGIEAEPAAAEALPWPDGHFDAAVSQLVVTFMRDAPRGVREMQRVVSAGGMVALCMWDRDGMEMLTALARAREALGAIDRTTEAGMAYRTREELEGLFHDGFEELSTDLLVVEASYIDFDDFWDALRGGANQSGQWAAALSGDALEQARAELWQQVGTPSGSFSLRAEAWALRARVRH